LINQIQTYHTRSQDQENYFNTSSKITWFCKRQDMKQDSYKFELKNQLLMSYA